jgi:ubiquinone/menaquinone biosynthesis C-methylase UbiE
MAHFKFDVARLERLNDPRRFETLDPGAMWLALGEPDPAIIVDVGAGTGLFAARFAEFAPAATVYAVDTEDAMIEWMHENRPEVAAGRIVPVKAEETKIPLPDDFAGLVVMINLHHELVDKAASYAEVFRLTKPGGQILVVDWRPGDSPKGPPQSVRASAEELMAWLERAGYVRPRSHGGLPWASLVTAERND